MLRFRDIKDPKAASSYYGKSDGGYYLDSFDLRREVGGKAAGMLGLDAKPDFEQFKRLLQGLDPHTGEQLTAKLIDGRIAGWDVTASIPKGVTVALERGDSRIHDALWEAGREAMADLEQHVTTRERKGGKQDDRVTGNLVWYGFEHPETRPAKEDGMPDPDRHIHFVIPNVTFDATEGEWKAIKFRPIMDLRKFFDRRFDMRLASKLTDLGYEVETKYKADSKGGKRYYSWDIKGIPQSVVTKFSRRAGEVEKLADQLGIENPVSKDKLGATSRLHKRDDMTLEDYRRYWNGRVSPDEALKVAEVIKAAMLGRNPRPVNTADKGVAFAIKHQFERRSVVDWHDLAITAMERCMGGARPEEIEPESRRQGVLLKNGEATTRDVLAEEDRIIQFAREGRGVYRPMGLATDIDASHKLSNDQKAVVGHIWRSTDQVIMIEGDAGTGKTDAMRVTIPGIDKPGVFLAPSASASRGTLREKGFSNADTIARFLVDERFREQARNGYVYIDEAPLAGLRDIDAVFQHAKELNARVILQGDRKQHKSVQRGNLFEILDKYAGLPVGRLTKNWRQQSDDYRDAVNALAKGDILGGYDKLAAVGWVKQVPVFDHNKPLADDYMASVEAGKSVLVVAPTHKEGDEITAEIRKRLKQTGRLGEGERTLETLVPLNWTEAERGDTSRYDGSEVVQFFRNSGPYRASQRLDAADFQPGRAKPGHFAVYGRGTLSIAPGETIRITANGNDTVYENGKRKRGNHAITNGSQYTVKGFNDKGDIVLANGWVVGSDYGHLAHGYVATSHASQGKTVDRVLIAMGHESRPAINAEQFYVSASRGRERATIYTDVSPAVLREDIQRSDKRKSATELMGKPKRKKKTKNKVMDFVKRVRETYRRLHENVVDATRELTRQKEMQYAGLER